MTASKSILSLTSLLLLSAVSTFCFSQHSDVPFENNYPVQPMGLFAPPLGAGPWTYPTAEGMDIKVSVVARIPYPMSLTFLANDDILVVTREGKIWRVKDRTLLVDPITGGPQSYFAGESGMPGTAHGYMDIALHPDFEKNHFIYLTYTKPIAEDKRALALGRGVWSGKALENFTDIKVLDTPIAYAGRIAFGHDKKIYLTTAGLDSQSLNDLGGKVLRLNDDGSIPKDNPFMNTENARGEIFSLGHRIGLGLTVHPTTGAIWQNENGPFGGDEINVIEAGKNYGWPLESLGRTYQGPWQSDKQRPSHETFEPPVVYWMPAVAPSGMTFYTGNKLSKWKGDIFVGSLRQGSIPGTGHLERILVNENFQELRREYLLTDLRQRVRDVRQGPDELLYLVTEEKDGALMIIEPAN